MANSIDRIAQSLLELSRRNQVSVTTTDTKIIISQGGQQYSVNRGRRGLRQEQVRVR